MKKTPKLSLLIFLVILASALTRCTKDQIQTNDDSLTAANKISSLSNKPRMQSLLSSYVENNISAALNPTSSTLKYEPDWNNAMISKNNTGITYHLYPLIISKIINGETKVLTEIGQKSFLIVKNQSEFYRGVYINANKESDQVEATKFSLKTFTGTLKMYSLQNKTYSIIPYKNGKVSEDYKSNKPKVNDGQMSTSGWEQVCNTRTDCTWTNVCAGIFMIHQTEGCSYPASPGPSCREWQLESSYQTQDCDIVWIEYPPTDPNDGGGGAGGGGGGEVDPLTVAFVSDIDANQLKPCLKTVLNKIISSDYNSIIMPVAVFSGGIPQYNWIMKSTSMGSNVNASTQNYNRTTHSVTTTFNEDMFSSTASDLSIARTILHESVHAYLVTAFGTNYDHASKTYPQMVDDFYSTYRANLNTVQHNEMAREWVYKIGVYLEVFGKNQGYNLPFQFYNDLAWGGLHETKAFKALPAADRTRISNVVLAEQTGVNTLGVPTPPKGRSGGCN